MSRSTLAGTVHLDWNSKPIGALFQHRNEGTTAEEHPPLSVTKSGIINQLPDVAISDQHAPKKLVRSGDLVINSRSDRKGSSGLADRDGSVSVINIILRPRGIHPRFAHHLLRSSWFQEEFYRFGSGIVADLWSTRYQSMKGIRVPNPPFRTQRDIADYLDHETAEIDALISELTRMASLLDERRVAAIKDEIPIANPFAPPPNSELVALKYLSQITLGKMLDSKAAEEGDLTLGYLRAANVQPMGRLDLQQMKSMRFTRKEARNLSLKRGDVVVVEGGQGGYGRAAFIDQDLPDTAFQNSIIRLRPHGHTSGEYITYSLILLRHIGYMNAVSSLTSMPHFTVERVEATTIPHLTLEEQEDRAERIGASWADISMLQTDLNRAITLAKERRAALITAAVTGQIDVTAKHRPAAEQLEDDIKELT